MNSRPQVGTSGEKAGVYDIALSISRGYRPKDVGNHRRGSPVGRGSLGPSQYAPSTCWENTDIDKAPSCLAEPTSPIW